MIKKVLIASGFLIGGYFLIKRLLPEFHTKYLQLNTKSADDVFAEKEKVRAEFEKYRKNAKIKSYTAYDPNNVDFGFKGLKGWQLNF